MALGQVGVHMGKKKFDPYLTPYAKINSYSVIDLCGKGKALKLVENDRDDFSIEKFFLGYKYHWP